MQHETSQRSGEDRRVAMRTVSFPLRNNKGITIAKDRRVNCDRRTQGLQVTESKMSQEAFNHYFNKFQKDDT